MRRAAYERVEVAPQPPQGEWRGGGVLVRCGKGQFKGEARTLPDFLSTVSWMPKGPDPESGTAGPWSVSLMRLVSH